MLSRADKHSQHIDSLFDKPSSSLRHLIHLVQREINLDASEMKDKVSENETISGAVASWPNPAGSWCQELRKGRGSSPSYGSDTASVEVSISWPTTEILVTTAQHTTSPSPLM